MDLLAICRAELSAFPLLSVHDDSMGQLKDLERATWTWLASKMELNPKQRG